MLFSTRTRAALSPVRTQEGKPHQGMPFLSRSVCRTLPDSIAFMDLPRGREPGPGAGPGFWCDGAAATALLWGDQPSDDGRFRQRWQQQMRQTASATFKGMAVGGRSKNPGFLGVSPQFTLWLAPASVHVMIPAIIRYRLSMFRGLSRFHRPRCQQLRTGGQVLYAAPCVQ